MAQGQALVPRVEALDIFAAEDAESTSQVGGSILVGSGIAFVRQGNFFYQIDVSKPEGKQVHQLTEGELSTLHMGNYHLYGPRIRLSAEEIGDHPFKPLLGRLQTEKSLHYCLDMIDVILDPLGEDHTEVRGRASVHIEEFLREHPERAQPIVDKIKSFIPPEEYKLDDLDVVVSPSSGGRSLAESCPLFSKILYEAQADWQRNAVEHPEKRLTREQIQRHHDDSTELASENLLLRAKESYSHFAQAIEDIKERGFGKELVLTLRRLPDAKGNILYLSKSLSEERMRFADAETRRPGVLGRYEEALSVITQAEKLLPELEALLGEPIKPSNFVG